jgi:phospholipid/cholesterol/gamma-HCH transport system substrate-binding protein
MEEDETKQRVKLGIFVVAGVVIFLVATIFLGSASNLFSRTFAVSAIFKNVEGLKEGDKVWLSGVQIGTISKVRIVVVGEVVVSMALKEKQNEFIRDNATASIGSDGLIGNRIVVIQPGNSPQAIQDGDTINAVSPADTQELINIAKEIGENTRTITLDLKAISGKINNGQGIIGELIDDGQFAQELRLTVQNLKKTGENTTKASAELSKLVYNVQHGEGLLPSIISDTSLKTTFQQTMTNVKMVSTNAGKMSVSLDSVITKMNNSDNAVGVILADTAFAHKLQRSMVNTESATLKLDENMEAMKHSFLTRAYFKKKAKQDKKEAEKIEAEKVLVKK